ncbi:MAG: DUF3574 domain-containing protein [Pyrinomonadaceae bacterium]
MRNPSLAILLVISLAANSQGVPMGQAFDSRWIVSEATFEKFIRTELYFGRNIPTGGTVSESDWQTFVDEIVTPRFPDGLTVLDADGQWRGKDGSIAREESKVIVLLYPRKIRKATNVKIEEIRAEYKKRFSQEAVMRIDVTKSVEVSF